MTNATHGSTGVWEVSVSPVPMRKAYGFHFPQKRWSEWKVNVDEAEKAATAMGCSRDYIVQSILYLADAGCLRLYPDRPTWVVVTLSHHDFSQWEAGKRNVLSISGNELPWPEPPR
jgi:hypothetical protein